jgi:hypothetical protein
VVYALPTMSSLNFFIELATGFCRPTTINNELISTTNHVDNRDEDQYHHTCISLDSFSCPFHVP